MVYYVDGIPGTKSLAAHRSLALYLDFKLKWEYSEMRSFVLCRMSPSIVRYNILLLHGPQYKEAQITQRLELTDGAVMELLAPWWG